MRFLKFILSHSVFIAFCAIGLCCQTHILLGLQEQPDLYGFVFFSTLCSYNFYWLLSKFYFSGRRFSVSFFLNNLSFALLFICSAAGVMFFLFRLQNLLLYMVPGVLLTLLYTLPLMPFSFTKKLQKAGFLKTTLLALTWAYVTAILPAAPFLPGQCIPVAVLFCSRFFFMLLLCIIFDMRDISVDKMNGLHSLATDVPEKKMNIIIHVVFIFYLITGLIVRNYFHAGAQMVSFLIITFVIWIVYRLSLKPQGYYFYYFLVDGLMLASAAGTMIAARLG